MPWTRRQVRYLESSGSPLTQAQKDKMNRELHNDPSLGHKEKGSKAMKKSEPAMPYRETHIQHHSDGSHTVTHHPHAKMAGKTGAFKEMPEPESYSAAHHELLPKLAEHLGMEQPDGDEGEEAGE
jgi:hypothetical protein